MIEMVVVGDNGRRAEKVVTKSGNLDGTFAYFYDGWKIVEIRDGSSNVLQQVYHRTQYIDEIVTIRLEKGYAVVYQDANWNTIATCDLAGRVLERVFTTPYGSPIIEPETYFGDYDGDGDVDATDDGFLVSGKTCWGTPTGACRVFDFNSDGTLDASDETIMTALVSAASTNRRHENRTVSQIGMAFLHQGSYWDGELPLAQYRNRSFMSCYQRFLQRDPARYLESMNLYQYVLNNPMNYLDPMGMDSLPCDKICSLYPPMKSVGSFAYSTCCTRIVEGRETCEPITCVDDIFYQAYGNEGCMYDCLMKHEQLHRDSHPCQQTCATCEPLPPDPGSENAEECAALRVEKECLKGCLGCTTNCLPWVEQYCNHLRWLEKFFCNPNNNGSKKRPVIPQPLPDLGECDWSRP